MKGHRVRFCAFFLNQSNINNDVTAFATGKINMKLMKGMQIKLGGATNSYIYVTLLLWQ